jgi:hypothetical protein
MDLQGLVHRAALVDITATIQAAAVVVENHVHPSVPLPLLAVDHLVVLPGALVHLVVVAEVIRAALEVRPAALREILVAPMDHQARAALADNIITKLIG